MTFSEPWWVAHLRWYAETEHRWDLALHIEAHKMFTLAALREIGDAIRPIAERLIAAIRAVH